MATSSNSISKQLLVGLPSTGKTTFTAALWHVVESAELPESLQLHDLDGDTSYLNTIRRAWLNCQEMERTEAGFQSLVSMKLKEPTVASEQNSSQAAERITQLFFPDVDGERFQGQWERRECEQEYATLVRGCSGLLLFIHPGKVKASMTIMKMDEILNGTNKAPAESQDNRTDAASENQQENPEEEEAIEWEPSCSATQVQLVELLQFIQALQDKEDEDEPFVGDPVLRVVVVVSAWDQIAKGGGALGGRGVEPAQWVKEHLPLLEQYLRANPEWFSTKFYGISAQGGDITNDAGVEELQNKHNTSERIHVRFEGRDCHDITEPLRWVISEVETKA